MEDNNTAANKSERSGLTDSINLCTKNLLQCQKQNEKKIIDNDCMIHELNYIR